MNLEKAIEILNEVKTGYWEGSCDDMEDAIKLSIEALKRLEDNRKKLGFPHTLLLLRETKE